MSPTSSPATSVELPLREDASDAELISRVRGGDVDSYGDLFARHREAATRLARQLVRGPDFDDLVSEAFAKVLNVLLGGGGPDVSFRPYLLTAVRRLHVDRIRATKRAMPTDDLTPYDPGVPFSDTVIAGFEGGAAAKAFASLPERWQLVLWHLEVEGAKPADVAPLLGMTPNSVSALAYRAREGLRQAFLQMHTADLVESECRQTHELLGAYVRKGLSRRDTNKVEEHLDGCRQCTAIFLELSEINSELAALLGPLVLGGAAAAYLAAGSTTGAVSGGFLIGVFDRAKDAVVGNSQAALAAGAAAAVAGVAVLALVVAQHDGTRPATADPRVPTTQAPVVPPVTPPTPTTPKPAPKATPKPVTKPTTRAPVRAASPTPTVAPPATSPVPPPATTPKPTTPKPTPATTPKPPPPPPPPPPPSTLLAVSGAFTSHGESENRDAVLTVRVVSGLVPLKLSYTLAAGSWARPPAGCTVAGAVLSCNGSQTTVAVRVQRAPDGTSIKVVADLPAPLPDLALPSLRVG